MNSTALLLIDLQNDYFPGGTNCLSGSPEAASNARLVLDFFRMNNWPVVHVQHHSIRRGATFFLPGTNGAEIYSEVKPLEGEEIVTKYFPNSFIKTNLLEILQRREIKKLVVCGMMTHMCVDATVRAAKDLGFEITLIHNACATKALAINGQTVEANHVHNSFVAALSYYYAESMSAEEFLVANA